MSVDLLCALEGHTDAKMCGIQRDLTFQHKLCHDFESLIWVIVYAMMVRRKNVLAATDLVVHAAYKEQLDGFWGVHSTTKLVNGHAALISAGIRRSRVIVEDLLFSDPIEAEFFRAAMRLLRSQSDDEESITYEKVQGLFQTYIQKSEQATPSAHTTA
jgi:hypothetical protein